VRAGQLPPSLLPLHRAVGTLSRWLVVWGLGLFVVAGLLSRTVDINEFSMHHFYRNR